MSYRHVFFVGHFKHDGSFAEPSVRRGSRIAIPVVVREIDTEAALRLAMTATCEDSERVESWAVSFRDGLLEFEEWKDFAAMQWIELLKSKQNVDIIEAGTMRVIPESEVSATVAYLRSGRE